MGDGRDSVQPLDRAVTGRHLERSREIPWRNLTSLVNYSAASAFPRLRSAAAVARRTAGILPTPLRSAQDDKAAGRLTKKIALLFRDRAFEALQD